MSINVPIKLTMENTARPKTVDSLIVNPSNMLLFIRNREYASGMYITIHPGCPDDMTQIFDGE